MVRKKNHFHNYLQIAIIFTLIVIFLYLTLFMIIDSGDHVIKSQVCTKLGGQCRINCLENELSKNDCKDGLICCIPLISESPKDNLNYEEAIEKKSLEHCNNIKSESMQKACTLKVLDILNKEHALKYSDSTYCEILSTKNKKQECYIELAELTKDIQYCKKLDTNYSKNNCFTNIAKFLKDPKICKENIKEESELNYCIKEIALISKDVNLCYNILNEYEKRDCILQIELLEKTPINFNCVKLDESDCLEEEFCEPIYFYTDCIGCSKKLFEICYYNNEKLCEDSGGSWNILYEECNCYSKVWFEGVGCFNCQEFNYQESKELCQNKK